MGKITINFKNLVEELENKDLKLCFVKNKDMFIEDAQLNLYLKETYYAKSYLDKLIKNEEVVEFNQVNSKYIEEWEKEIWAVSEVKAFIERHSL